MLKMLKQTKPYKTEDKMKVRLILTSIITVISVSVYGQTNVNWNEGQLLIRLNSDTETGALLKEFIDLELKDAKLISKHMNIWKFEYNSNLATIDAAIKRVNSSSNVMTVQRNHILTQRATVPNDAGFGQQWQYVQTNDKDIDADLAWDETTGGLTPNGDTIVVCVIDDGVNLSHPDLIPNLWVNHNEIPNNNIDDDGNGYVDDVKGWNAYDQGNNVSHTPPWGGHGSAVAGIVGAKGNNNIGVTGVNWDVKLMIVKGGGNESEAIAAYSYALENRKLYNSSNGAYGAYVVATNASWGVNGGQASNAPLWCAMYDTLGNYGILNAGATINGNENIDVFGDLPTQCPSDFLIAVTNTDQNDNKVTQAGYGAINIDLGAPGEGTWTVADQATGSGYSGFGGTSGATPHVAGTIGLLYSVECMSFAETAKNNPKLAAEMVRGYILNSVDANASLVGITVTEGRLNVNGSVQALLSDCGGLGIEERHSNLSNNLVVYPNPIQNNLINVAFSSEQNGVGYIEISDITGKIISKETIQVLSDQNTYELYLPQMSNGIYNLKIVSGSKSTAVKFVK